MKPLHPRGLDADRTLDDVERVFDDDEGMTCVRRLQARTKVPVIDRESVNILVDDEEPPRSLGRARPGGRPSQVRHLGPFVARGLVALEGVVSAVAARGADASFVRADREMVTRRWYRGESGDELAVVKHPDILDPAAILADASDDVRAIVDDGDTTCGSRRGQRGAGSAACSVQVASFAPRLKTRSLARPNTKPPKT